MNTALWIVAWLLAAVGLVGAVSKLTVAKEKLAATPGGEWVEDFDAATVKALGALDLAIALGLVLPALLDIAPALTPLAAVGFALLMVGAIVVRLRHGGTHAIAVDLTYLLLALFVAIGRLGPEPFSR